MTFDLQSHIAIANAAYFRALKTGVEIGKRSSGPARPSPDASELSAPGTVAAAGSLTALGEES